MMKIGILSLMSDSSGKNYLSKIEHYCLMADIDFPRTIYRNGNYDRIAKHVAEDNWDNIGEEAVKKAKEIKRAGADFLLIVASTMHKVAPAIECLLDFPVLSIVEPVAERLKNDGHDMALGLGSKKAMSMSFLGEEFEEEGIFLTTPRPDHLDRLEEIRLAKNPGDAMEFNNMLGLYSVPTIILCNSFSAQFSKNFWEVDDSISGRVYHAANLHVKAAIDKVKNSR